MIKLFDILNEWKLPPPTVPSKGYYKKAKEILLAKGYDTDSIKWIADAE